MRSLFVALLLVPSLALAKPKVPKQVDDVKYYFGPVDYRSPDDTKSYGQGASLVRRVISADHDRITEEVVQPPRAPGQSAKTFSVTLTREGSSTRFSGTDTEKSFTGGITFGAKDSPVDWTYDIKLTVGGTLTGKGRLEASGLNTDKLLTDPSGQPKMLIKERLAPITEAEWDTRKKSLIAPPK